MHKDLVQYCLQQLLSMPTVKCENLPSTARATVTEKANMHMIHVKLTHPEPRGRYNVIEDRPVLSDGVVYLKGDSAKAVYLAPEQRPLAYELVDEYIRIPLPKVDGYAMVVVER